MIERIRSCAAACVIAQQIEDGSLYGMEHLRARRKQLGETQLQICRKVGVPKNTYQNWEEGKNWPSSIYLPRLAMALKCSIEELYLPPED